MGATPSDDTTIQLVGAAVDAGAQHVIAAGGVREARDTEAMRAAGAAWFQVGTPFLCTDECGLTREGKELVKRGGVTHVTRSLSGRPARGLCTLVDDERCVPAVYPHVNELTAPLRAEAKRRADATRQSVWAGEPCQAAVGRTAAEIVAELAGTSARAAPG